MGRLPPANLYFILPSRPRRRSEFLQLPPYPRLQNTPAHSAAQLFAANKTKNPELETELQTALAWEETLERQQKIAERIALIPFLLYGLPFLLFFLLPFLWETLLGMLF